MLMPQEGGDNYLILGAGGQVGSELSRRFADTLALCKPREAVDITDFAQVKKIIRSAKPAAVLNVAGNNNKAIPDCDRPGMWMTNAAAVDHLVRVCAMYGVPFIHLSSDEVYGGDLRSHTPHKELSLCCPSTYYGHTKLAAEHAILHAGQVMLPDVAVSRFKYIIIRTSLPYEQVSSYRLTFVNQIAALVRKRHKDSVPIPEDIVRSPTYVPHLADQLIWLLEHVDDVPSGVYHVANRGSASLYDLAAMICANQRSPTGVRPCRRIDLHDEYELRKLPLYTALDCSAWDEICPIPMPTWEEGLEECLAVRGSRRAAVS